MISLRLALGELGDHKGAYLAIILVFAVSLMPLTIVNSFIDYQNSVGEKAMKTTFTGDALIQNDGGVGTPSVASFLPVGEIPDAESRAAKLREKGYKAEVQASIFGITGATEGKGVKLIPMLSLTGIHTDGDVLDIESSIVEGSYFDESVSYTDENGYGITGLMGYMRAVYSMLTIMPIPDNILSFVSEHLPSGKPYPLIIARSRAEIMGAEIGDLIPMVPFGTMYGMGAMAGMSTPLEEMNIMDAMMAMMKTPMSSTDFEIIGFYETGYTDPEIFVGFVPIESVREMAGWSGERGTAIMVKGDAEPGVLKEELMALEPDLSVYTWYDIVEAMMGDTYGIMRSVSLIFTVIMMCIVAIAIAATMNSAVNKKIGEIGMLKARGLSDGGASTLFLHQSWLLGAISGGLSLSALFVLKLITMVMPLSIKMTMMGMPLEIPLHLTFSAPLILATMLVPIIVALMGAAYPSVKAFRLTPVEALREGAAAL